MKVTMDMTLDGLVRALRWKALDLAERTQHDYLSARRSSTRRPEVRRSEDRNTEEAGDDRGGG